MGENEQLVLPQEGQPDVPRPLEVEYQDDEMDLKKVQSLEVLDI